MKRIVITYGLIAGTIVAAMMLITMPLFKNGTLNHEDGELYGYSTMVIALSMVFFGVKTFRDKHSNGTITFGQGLTVGLLITLIAAVMYSTAWEISLVTEDMGDYMTTWIQQQYDEMKATGATEAELQEWKAKWDKFLGYYDIMPIRFVITMVEILPVGIIISLISAALLRKKEFLPSTEGA
ncbi:MAG TPA: DUF4199 domain-containing protein [Cyclobacteriaceae bacterium]|nr:DUF4199 domain-containing protein [Cyclobacteriaceae bacterium]